MLDLVYYVLSYILIYKKSLFEYIEVWKTYTSLNEILTIPLLRAQSITFTTTP